MTAGSGRGPWRVVQWTTVEHGYVVEVDGEPKIRTKLEIWPHQEDLSALTLADLPVITSRGRLQAY